MRYFFIFPLLCALTPLRAQSSTVADFREQHATSQDFFLYPSTLRMINLDKNPDLYKLVHDVEKLQILLFDQSSVDGSAMQQLRQGIQKETYEELISFRQQGSQIAVYARGDSPTLDGVVGVVDNQQTLALIDLEGFVDLPALMRLVQGGYDFSPMTNLVNLSLKEQTENDQQEHD